MKSRHVLKWFCEFCGRGRQGKKRMQEHESHCIMNPNRKCRMCELHSLHPNPLADLIAGMNDSGNDDTVLRMADGCPECTLAAIKQDKKESPEFYDEGDNFDYQKARQELASRFSASESLSDAF